MNFMPMASAPFSSLVLKDGLGCIPRRNPLELGHTLGRANVEGNVCGAAGSWCSPRVIHTDTMRHWLELNVGGCSGRGMLWWAPGRPPPLPFLTQASSYADTRTLAVLSVQTVPNFIWSMWFHPLQPQSNWSEKRSGIGRDKRGGGGS